MMTELKNQIEKVNNLVTTENGALGYKSTGKDLVDLNFRIPSMRKGLDWNDLDQFKSAINDNIVYAVKWLFFVRDIRGGLGERDTFVRFYQVLFDENSTVAISLLPLIAEYGRWGDVVDIAFGGSDTLKKEAFKVIEKQLKEDVTNSTQGKPISLLAKWLPSINASRKSRAKAVDIINHLYMNMASYRKMLSKLRKYLDVTEVKTCGNKWGEIDYNKVSSNANLRYKDAFMKHDEIRRREYLAELSKPNSSVKMNAGDLYPHEIWNKYTKCGNNNYQFYYGKSMIEEDDLALEGMWNNLKNLGNVGNTMCVCDGSGSMCITLPNSNSVRAIDVSRSLSVYFAERCEGEYHNKFIEFSSTPQFIELDGCKNLREKINHVERYNDCSNTDIEKVFQLLLHTAIENKMTQKDMPERILIVSDMEFDCATTISPFGKSDTYISQFTTLFDALKNEYESHGFKLPKLVFWNVNSRTNTIPVTENEMGVTLISGFSINLLKLVMSNETDPWLILKETLDSERYLAIENIIKDCSDEV